MSEKKRVVIAGATGEIGSVLCKRLLEENYELVVLSRDPEKARKTVGGAADYLAWHAEPEAAEPWARAIDGAYAVVNLAGAPFFQRWTEEYEREVHDSRMNGTRGLIDAMRQAANRPRVFIYGSSVGYYGYEGFTDKAFDEHSPRGDDFWGQDSQGLEAEAEKAGQTGVRTVLVRTGVVLDRNAGVLAGAIPQFRSNFGGWILPGSQWVSWIHIDDEVGLIKFALEDERVQGALNATAPEPQTNHDFYRTLGKVMHRPCWFPMPGFMLRLFLGKVAAIIIHGRRVIPEKALNLGYRFHYPTSEQALRQLLEETPV